MNERIDYLYHQEAEEFERWFLPHDLSDYEYEDNTDYEYYY